ncbi:MAG: GTPase [Actinobacteria bacterium]|nr:GTPase [Actinomycetota bacterium]
MSERILILGAAGRDFHNFNVLYRDDPHYDVVAFTATQIPNIDGRRYPASLAGELYPYGIPILPEEDMERLIAVYNVDRVVFAYSDVTHEHVMHLAARAVAAGASYELPGAQTMIPSDLPVVAVTAARTGAGKSPTSRAVWHTLNAAGRRVAAIRHPMPYGDLVRQAVQRFASNQDLIDADCSIEEREEYEPYIEQGGVIFAGVDYEAILRLAEQEADVILWDGGNNDLPFYRPDLHICVVDPHRPGHELRYWPGEANLRRADVVMINKVGTAEEKNVAAVLADVREANPSAVVLEAHSPITVADPDLIAGRRVLVVEDGPTLTHGGMAYGAGVIASRQFGAAELIDPRPFAVGSIADTFAKFSHIGRLLPAMGYGEEQRAELAETIRRANPEVVVVATPVNLLPLLDLDMPGTRVTYGIEIVKGPSLREILAGL